MRLRTLVFCGGLLFLLLFPVLAFSQTVCSTNCVVLRNEPFSVLATHDGVETDGYRVRFGSTIVADALTATVLSGTTVTIPFPAGLATAGTFQVTVSAYNRDIDGSIAETASTAIQVTIRTRRAPPGQVTNLRIQTANR
jgi:hypothetical protein